MEKGKESMTMEKLRNHIIIDKTAVRTGWKGRAKGGMIMAVSNKLEWKRMKEEYTEKKSQEVIAMEVKLGNRKWILITVYMNKYKGGKLEDDRENNREQPRSPGVSRRRLRCEDSR